MSKFHLIGSLSIKNFLNVLTILFLVLHFRNEHGNFPFREHFTCYKICEP